jgi:phospholipase/carboxylesterase
MRERTPGGITRRHFFRIGLGALAAPTLSGYPASCPADAKVRLSARPGLPSVAPPRLATRLGLGTGRDGLLYVPATYSPDGPAPLLVALHGAGGSGAAWRSLPERAEARGMVVLAPDSRGATWDLVLGGFGPDVAFLDRALRFTFERCRIDSSRVALGGFSDGASYALSLGVSNGDLFTHLVAHSPGFFSPAGSSVGKPRIFVSHGTRDEIIPVSISRDGTVPELRRRGYDVTYLEFDGPHRVPPDILDAALTWFLGPGR